MQVKRRLHCSVPTSWSSLGLCERYSGAG
jgi:hypothetical protein